jgi:uncharacterized membrane protein (UPF0127 family)
MKLLRVLRLLSTGTLAVGLFIFAGCQKSPAPAPPAAVAEAPTNSAPANNVWEPQEAQPKLPTVKLYVGAEQMDAEICATPRQVQTGMMFRKTMGTNDAMLFTLGGPQQAGFWMKNCYVPLSVAYIDPDGVIQDILPLQVQDTNTVFSTGSNIQFALETPQGWFESHHITTGMVVRTERGSLLETYRQRQ